MITTSLSLAPGSYYLTFDLAGNQRNDASESVKVDAPGFSSSYSLAKLAPFTTYLETFTVGAAGSYDISFEGLGVDGDNIGMLLDNVDVSVVPVPGAVLLGILGLGVAGLKLRKFA